jgi:GT2 family glycosyltransferase
MESIPTVTVKSMMALDHDGIDFTFTMNSLVYDARNTLAKKAHDGGYDRIMWIDSDMVFEPDLYRRLSARMDEGYDFVTGLYFTRRMPISPVIYKSITMDEKDGKYIPNAVEYDDYPKDSIFEVKGAGFGGCMMTMKMVMDIVETYGLPFSPVLGLGEDLSFCMKATQLGYKLFCDSSIKLGHKSHCVVYEADYERSLNK